MQSRAGQKLEGGRAGAFLFWPTSFGETLPIPGAEKMLTLQNNLQNLSWTPPPTHTKATSQYCSMVELYDTDPKTNREENELHSFLTLRSCSLWFHCETMEREKVRVDSNSNNWEG